MLTRRLCWILLTAVVVQGYPGYPKVWVPPHASKFNVTYKQEVKLVLNVEESVTYCLYEADSAKQQCHPSTRPVKIPLGRAYVEPTPVIPLFEYIGERGNIGSVINLVYITSTCVKQMINDAQILQAGTNIGTEKFCVNTSSFYEKKITAAFAGNKIKPCDSSVDLPTTILYSDGAEDKMEDKMNHPEIILAQAEWIYYVATFYNKEHLAVKFLHNLYGKWDCIMTSIAECNRGFQIAARLKVAFMPYYDKDEESKKWEPPNPYSYYAQMINYSNAEMMNCLSDSNMTTKFLFDCIEKADVCIFETNYTAISQEDRDTLKKLNCIKNNAYYDVYGNINSWFEDTSTSADDLLCEFVYAINKQQHVIDVGRGVVYNPRWLRNSSQIESNANITSSELRCPSPDYKYPAPITPFDCAGCGSNLPLFDALFAFFVQLSALALCCAVVMSLRKIHMSNHQKRQQY